MSGASGGGKSTLLTALAEAGFQTVPEPGLRVIAAGGPDPSTDIEGFARAAIALALVDYESVGDGVTIFDRSLVDAVAALIRAGKAEEADLRLLESHRYDDPVILVPFWPEIFETTETRKHGGQEALVEYHDLAARFPALGYRLAHMPKASIPDRVAWVAEQLGD